MKICEEEPWNLIFRNCTALTSIPKDLFCACASLETFSDTFFGYSEEEERRKFIHWLENWGKENE